MPAKGLLLAAAALAFSVEAAQARPKGADVRLPESGERLLAFVPPGSAGPQAHLGWGRLFDASRLSAVPADGLPGAGPRVQGPSGAWSPDRVPQEYRRTFRILMRRSAEIDRFDPAILKHSQSHGLNPRLLKAIIAAESEFNALARSPAGALGLMQVMPLTAEFMGVPRGRLFEPEANITAGAAYLAHLFQKAYSYYKLSGRYVDAPRWLVRRVIAAYNAGLRFIRHRPLYRETELYVAKVLWYLSSEVTFLRAHS